MAQIFHPAANIVAKASIAGAILFGGLIGFLTYEVVRSDWATEVGLPKEQPVQFSHEHHVKGLGIDCRFCHNSVENSAYAGMPSTKVCMTCHSQIWTNAPLLEEVRASWRDDRPIKWNLVHDLPDFVAFNHSIHVQKGVGCYECHGEVDEMPLLWKSHSLHMTWCLDCHRNPERHVRPRGEKIWDMNAWVPDPKEGKTRVEAGLELVKKYNIQVAVPSDPGFEKHHHPLTSCSRCHY
jgi:hypothetical protein